MNETAHTCFQKNVLLYLGFEKPMTMGMPSSGGPTRISSHENAHLSFQVAEQALLDLHFFWSRQSKKKKKKGKHHTDYERKIQEQNGESRMSSEMFCFVFKKCFCLETKEEKKLHLEAPIMSRVDNVQCKLGGGGGGSGFGSGSMQLIHM